MNNKIESSSQAEAGSFLRKVASILLCIALAIAIYLAWQSAAGKAIAGCGPESGCGKILTSRWSVVGGVPVSLLGAAAYVALIVSALRGEAKSLWGRRIECGASVLVLGGAVWFTIVQAVILKAFCPWCCTAHFLASIGVVMLWSARRKAPGFAAAARPELAAFVLPVVAVAGMATLQGLLPEPERIQQRTLAQSVVSNAGGVSLYDGRITLDAAGLPLIGLPGSSLTAVAITDFTCPHCRELHHTLSQLVVQRPGQFNVVLLPGATEPEARELHRIMLTLWRIDRDRYKTLSDELIGGSVNPKVSEVTGWLQKRLDGKFYELAWVHADWVQATLRQGEELLALNRKEAGASILPQIMIRDRVLTGAPHSETLTALLDAVPATATPKKPDPAPVAVPAAATTAAIAFESTTIDFGTVTKGEVATKKIFFINTGTAPLTIIHIKAGCGCTTIEGWEQTVPPGQKGSFEIKLNTSQFSGLVTKSVDVESNAVNGMPRLTLTANIWSPVSVSSPTVSFGPVVKGTKLEPRVIEIVVTEPEPLKISGFTSSNPYFKTEMKVLEEGRRYQLSVSVPEMGESPQSGEIILPVGHPRFKELKLQTSISPVEPLVVQPQQLNISAATLQAAPTTSVTVFCYDPAVTALEVTDLVYEGVGKVGVAFESQGDSKWGRVVLTFPAGFTWNDGSRAASVSFRTNHPKYPKFTIPVHFIGAPPDASATR